MNAHESETAVPEERNAVPETGGSVPERMRGVPDFPGSAARGTESPAARSVGPERHVGLQREAKDVKILSRFLALELAIAAAFVIETAPAAALCMVAAALILTRRKTT